MATLEQSSTWLKTIRENVSEEIYGGTNRELVISPAEKIRYTENAKLGAVLVEDLEWLIEQDTNLTVEELAKRHAKIESSLTSDKQRSYFTDVKGRLEKKAEVTKKIGRTETLRRIQACLDGVATAVLRQAGELERDEEDRELFPFQLSTLDPRDVEVTTFGAVVITVRDEKIWTDQIGLPMTLRGVKMQGFAEEHLIPRAHLKAFGQVVFLFQSERVSPDAYRKIRSHELFHHYYALAFEEGAAVAYPPGNKRAYFSMLKNELIAYTLGEEWQTSYRGLLNRGKDGTETDLLKFIQHSVMVEAVEGGQDLSAANKEADEFLRHMRCLRAELVRLSIKKSQAFKEMLTHLLAAESVKELAYHLSSIEAGPINPHKTVSKNAKGLFDDSGTEAFLKQSLQYGFQTEGMADFLAAIREQIQTALAEKIHPAKRQYFEGFSVFIDKNEAKLLALDIQHKM